MRILFITNNLPPIVDGVGDYTLNIAKKFVSHGHEVLIACHADGRINKDVPGMGVYPVVEAWNKRGAGRLLSLIKESKPDVVSLQYVPHGFHPKGLPFGLIGVVREIKKQNVRLMTFAHEVSVVPDIHNPKIFVLGILMQHISQSILKASDIVATSIGHYACMIKNLTGRKPDAIIPIPSNIPFCLPSDDEFCAIKRKVAPNGEFVIGFIGRRKIDNCVEAIMQLVKEGRKIKLLSIGSTSLLDYDNPEIYKTGVLPIEKLYTYVSLCDCIIIPENEKYGCSFKSGSLIAALSAGRVVITQKGCMTDNCLKDGENIIFCKDKEYAYREKILPLINDESLTTKISTKAKMIAFGISWESTYKEYMRIIGKDSKEYGGK